MRSSVRLRRNIFAGLGGAVSAGLVLAAAVVFVLPAVCDPTAAEGRCDVAEGALADAQAGLAVADEVAALTETAPEPRLEAAAVAASVQPSPASAGETDDGGVDEPESGVLTSRVVRAIPVGPDGKPIFSAVTQPQPVKPQPSTDLGASLVAPAEDRPGTPAEPEPASPALPDEGVPPAATVAVVAPVPRMRPEGLGAESQPAGPTLTVGGSGVNAREGPSRSRAMLFVLAPGAKVTQLDEERGWLKVVDEDGRTGWVYQDFVR